MLKIYPFSYGLEISQGVKWVWPYFVGVACGCGSRDEEDGSITSDNPKLVKQPICCLPAETTPTVSLLATPAFFKNCLDSVQ